LIQTTEKLRFDNGRIEAIRNFFGSLSLKGLRIAWEKGEKKGYY